MKKRIELLEGERILIDEPIHWKNHLPSLLTMALCVFLVLVRLHERNASLLNWIMRRQVLAPGLMKYVVAFELAALVLLIAAAFVRTVDISYIHYYVTNRRIIATSGVINRQFSEMLLNKCEMIYLNQNAYERMYSCGDILCVAAGSSLFLDDVKDAVDFKQRLMQLLSEREAAR